MNAQAILTSYSLLVVFLCAWHVCMFDPSTVLRSDTSVNLKALQMIIWLSAFAGSFILNIGSNACLTISYYICLVTSCAILISCLCLMTFLCIFCSMFFYPCFMSTLAFDEFAGAGGSISAARSRDVCANPSISVSSFTSAHGTSLDYHCFGAKPPSSWRVRYFILIFRLSASKDLLCWIGYSYRWKLGSHMGVNWWGIRTDWTTYDSAGNGSPWRRVSAKLIKHCQPALFLPLLTSCFRWKRIVSRYPALVLVRARRLMWWAVNHERMTWLNILMMVMAMIGTSVVSARSQVSISASHGRDFDIIHKFCHLASGAVPETTAAIAERYSAVSAKTVAVECVHVLEWTTAQLPASWNF